MTTEQETLVARADRLDDGRLALRSPTVGVFRDGPGAAAVLTPGSRLGTIEVLGKRVAIMVPPDAGGAVVRTDAVIGAGAARRPVAFDDVLAVVDPTRAGVELGDAAGSDGTALDGSSSGPVFRAPSSGRFYRRPAPDKDPFVEVGTEIGAGQTLGLLEVMKTFSRLVYQPSNAEGLPPQAKVVAILPEDGDDVEVGAPLVELEPL